MNKQIRNKILGAFVVVGLVIILLPFFQSSEEVPATTALVSAPAFPDQAVQVAAPAEQPVPTDEVPKQVFPSADNAKTADNSAAVKSSENAVKQVPDDTVQNMHTDNTTTQAIAAPTVVNEPVKVAVTKKKPAAPIAKVAAQAKKAPAPTKRKMYDSAHQSPIIDDGLFALKNPAWVVQIGSFKDKANALRMVNQLRAKGYRAFIQKVATAFGENTRVFVGPEKKHNSAAVLATQLETDLHLHGIVISYKPLTL